MEYIRIRINKIYANPPSVAVTSAKEQKYEGGKTQNSLDSGSMNWKLVPKFVFIAFKQGSKYKVRAIDTESTELL